MHISRRKMYIMHLYVHIIHYFILSIFTYMSTNFRDFPDFYQKALLHFMHG